MVVSGSAFAVCAANDGFEIGLRWWGGAVADTGFLGISASAWRSWRVGMAVSLRGGRSDGWVHGTCCWDEFIECVPSSVWNSELYLVLETVS